MTPETQAQWLASARGKNLRDIEELVAGRKKGDSPDDAQDPELFVHEVRLKLTARTKALWEQMRAALETECDGRLEDDQLVEAVARRVLAGDSAPSARPSRPAHRIIVHKCDDCGRARQEARGRRIQLGEADLALAECDAIAPPRLAFFTECARRGAAPTWALATCVAARAPSPEREPVS